MGGVQMGIVSLLKGLAQEELDQVENFQRQKSMEKYYDDWMKRTEEITGRPCNSPSEIRWDD